MDFPHITGIDVMFFAALFAAYLRYRYPERPDPQVQRIRELVRAGCWATAAEEVRAYFGEESEGL
jgi:heme/copper-type cytochrome/quinol oxidase subunit 3